MDHIREVSSSSELALRVHNILHSPLLYSGYDFGYLVRLLTNCKLPDKEKDFFELLSIFFPKLYDVKYLMKSCKSLKGGLQEVADSLEVGLD